MSGSPGKLIDGSPNSKSGIGIAIENDSEGRLGSEMSGSPGMLIDGRLMLGSKLGIGISIEKLSDGSEGKEMSGSPGRDSEGNPQLIGLL